MQTRRRFWKNSPWDAVLVAISVVHFSAIVLTLALWNATPISLRILEGVVLAALTAYNIVVVSHLFTHAGWFTDSRLNAAASVLNSMNAGQSVQAYQFTHVRNHHRYTNDRRDSAGTTRDRSSTYRRGRDGEHEPVASYALGGAVESMVTRGYDLIAVRRLWRVHTKEEVLLSLAAKNAGRRSRELRQIQLDRAAHSLLLAAGVAISWQWTLLCYLPAFFVALTMVNVQNYYRHFGANPDELTANSVSHYARIYNLLTFNDGYHQEHHMAPGTHWSKMPQVRRRLQARLDTHSRIVSPVPAMVGFLDGGRPLLHRSVEVEGAS